MRFFKYIDDDYLLGIGKGSGGIEITESEYDEIMSIIQNIPQETNEIGYKLTTSLEWESYKKEPQTEQEELNDSETLNIILGGAL